MNGTKLRILDAAERLFAELGFDVSIRAITDKAGVNLAAVNYHFQSKEALLDAIIARRIEPVNKRRLEMLDAIEAQTGDGPLSLEAVLEAFLAPVLEAPFEHFKPLIGRMYSVPEEFIKRVFHMHLAPIVVRFDAAFARALPDLPESERIWRLYFSIGAMVHVMNWSRVLGPISNGLLDPSDTRALMRRMVAFAAAGFRAPVLETNPSVEEPTNA